MTINGRELRQRHIDAMDAAEYDVFIIGGGINGAVSAASLASRGLKVGLADRGDFASFTSQESSNMVWGGFKYLQNYELPLVAKLCRSRNKLMKAYPTNITEIRFLATLDDSSPYPSWLAALGTVAYWGIGALATRPPKLYFAKRLKNTAPVVKTSSADGAVEYADAYLRENDSRFVWSMIRTALNYGADAINYLSVSGAIRQDGRWRIELKDELSDRTYTCSASSIINAAGPFIDGLNEKLSVRTEHRIVYSKGIHLVVPRIGTEERVLAFFDDTQRLFYLLPMAHRSVIGTTDTRTDNPNEPVTMEDRRFVLDQINARLDLERPLRLEDIIAERSGVRPLVIPRNDDDHADIDWTTLSRKHEIEVDEERRVISVFGGKLTDCLNVGEEVADAVRSLNLSFVRDDPKLWFGEETAGQRKAFYEEAAKVGFDRKPSVEIAESIAEVLWRRHGLGAYEVIKSTLADPAAGTDVLPGSDVLRGEMNLFRQKEMIVELEDFLRRRTKLSLIFTEEDLAPAVDEFKSLLFD